MSTNTVKRAKERWERGTFVPADAKWVRRYQKKLWKAAEKKATR